MGRGFNGVLASRGVGTVVAMDKVVVGLVSVYGYVFSEVIVGAIVEVLVGTVVVVDVV